jgi:hypothetical protein
MTEQERDRIERDADFKNRIGNLEKASQQTNASLARLWYGVGAAAAMILASIWDGLKAVLFK